MKIKIKDLESIETLELEKLELNDLDNIRGGELPPCATRTLAELYKAIAARDAKAVWEANAQLLECFEPYL
ncbi:MAG: hypothetical protein QNJ55_28785 [Xenococcus sp. MO_188.B8]|nr:hypothetical protein [Xenococcus sp. MO_188.B8]